MLEGILVFDGADGDADAQLGNLSVSAVQCDAEQVRILFTSVAAS